MIHAFKLDPKTGKLSLDGFELNGVLDYRLTKNCSAPMGKSPGYLTVRLLVRTKLQTLVEQVADNAGPDLDESVER